MSMNMLRQLPPGFCHCQHLVELHLNNNMLTDAAFPEEFSALTQLTCALRGRANLDSCL